MVVCKTWRVSRELLSVCRLFYSSLFTDVWTVAKWSLLYWKRAYRCLFPMWVQFTYYSGKGCHLLSSLMDSSMQNQIITQPLPGVAAQSICYCPWYRFTAIALSLVRCWRAYKYTCNTIVIACLNLPAAFVTRALHQICGHTGLWATQTWCIQREFLSLHFPYFKAICWRAFESFLFCLN